MQFSEAQQWLKTLGVKCRITEEAWQKMDDQTRSLFMSGTTDIVSRMRALEADHKPDGWPAVQMRDISTLCDIIEGDSCIPCSEIVSCYEGMDGYALVDKAEWARLRAENSRLKRELSNAVREFDRVTGWGESVLAPLADLMDVTATLP